MKLIYAVALSIIAGAAQAAETGPSLNVPTGAVIDCLPVPSIETLNKGTVYVSGKPVLPARVTCTVSKGQSIPQHSQFVGRQVAGPVSNSYTFVWELMLLPGGYSVRSENVGSAMFSTALGDSGHLRVTFDKNLSATLP